VRIWFDTEGDFLDAVAIREDSDCIVITAIAKYF
jgi:hypothetical protein